VEAIPSTHGARSAPRCTRPFPSAGLAGRRDRLRRFGIPISPWARSAPLLHWYNTLLPSVFRPWCLPKLMVGSQRYAIPLCFSGPVWQRIGPFLIAQSGIDAALVNVTPERAIWSHNPILPFSLTTSTPFIVALSLPSPDGTNVRSARRHGRSLVNPRRHRFTACVGFLRHSRASSSCPPLAA
jgi:hypothetical protein